MKIDHIIVNSKYDKGISITQYHVELYNHVLFVSGSLSISV